MTVFSWVWSEGLLFPTMKGELAAFSINFVQAPSKVYEQRLQTKAEREAEAKNAEEEWGEREQKTAEKGGWRQTGARAKGRGKTETDGVIIAMLIFAVLLLCLVLTAP